VISDKGNGVQKLYFGDGSTLKVPLSWFELPPVAPEGGFDARFASNRMFEPLSGEKETKYVISVQSSKYPITLSCEGAGSDLKYINVTDADRGTPIGTIVSDGKTVVKITNPAITKIQVTIKTGITIPKVFSLEQNYPNPFNPTTTIQFNLPEPVIVNMQVFNILGQQVASLVDHVAYEPGSHFASWNASNFSSGVYFYRLIATRQTNGEVAFQQVKKLVLVK
jgi:hypothetical protein